MFPQNEEIGVRELFLTQRIFLQIYFKNIIFFHIYKTFGHSRHKFYKRRTSTTTYGPIGSLYGSSFDIVMSPEKTYVYGTTSVCLTLMSLYTSTQRDETLRTD